MSAKEQYSSTYEAVLKSIDDPSLQLGPLSIGEEKHVLEVVLRSLALQTTEKVRLECILELSFSLARKDTIPANVPSVIASDFLSCGTVDDCFENLFAIVEDQLAQWKSPKFFVLSKNSLLRTCNDLLRRVCRAHMTKFCGRIQIFLSKLYPMTEKSALNLTSSFNQDRISEQDHEPHTNRMADHFSILQRFLIDPSSAVKRWDAFADSLNCILDCLYSYKLAPEQCTTTRQLSFVSTFTSESDLDSQMSDPLFRQQFLIQILIACRYFTDPIKFRQDHLSNEMLNELDKAVRKSGQLLEECSNQEQNLKEQILGILERESRTWNAWKNAGCQAELMMTADEADVDEFEEPALKKPYNEVNLPRQISSESALKTIGQQQQSLWATEQTPIQELTASPDFFDSALKIFDLKTKPSEFVVPDETWSWRALRLARGTKILIPSNQTPRKVNEFLFHLLHKMKTRQINRESAKLVAKDPPVVPERTEPVGQTPPPSE